MELDTFDNPAPIQDIKDIPEQGGGTGQGFESFDDDTVITPDQIKEGEKLPDDENGLDETQTDQIRTEKDDEKKEEPKKEEEKPEPKKEDEPAKEEKPVVKGKSIKIKDSEGRTTDIDNEATVKVKVNGKNEFVSIKELQANYSGKVAYDEKFKNLESDNYALKQQKEQFEAERNEVVSKLQDISRMLDDENARPLDALYYLVDMTGRDTLQFNKKVMEHLSNEVRTLDGMDEVERELYWKNKEVEAIRSNQAAKAEKDSQAQARRERIEKINQLRESQGVTEEQFIQSHNELKKLGYEESKITPEAIVNYSVMKPHFEKSEELCSDYQDELGDTDFDKLVTTVANTLKSYPNLSEEKAFKFSLDQLGWDYETEEDDFREINDAANFKKESDVEENYRYGQRATSKPSEAKIESFDDFDY